MTACRTVAEVRAAAAADAKDDPPLTQAGADLAAALIQPHLQADKRGAA